MATKTSTKSSASAPKRKPPSTPPAAKLDGATMTERTAPVAAREQKVAARKTMPSHEQIAFRAFELYQKRAPTDGGALNDWLSAERELLAS